MKKIYLTLLTLCITSALFSQTNTFPTSGNAGIGTLSPNSILEVKSTGAGNQIRIWDHSWPDDSYVGLGIYGSGQTSELASLGFRYHIGGTSDNGIQLGTSTSALMTLLMNGKVGVGRSNPSYKLHVAGDIRGSSTVSVEKNGNYRVALNGQSHGYIIGTNDSNESKFLIHSNGTSYMKGGYVGIGTSTTLSRLHVSSALSGGTPYNTDGITIDNTSRSVLQMLTHNTGDQYLMFGDVDKANRAWVGYNHNIDQMNFTFHNTAGKFAFTNGNVGIGVADPSEQLEVNGTIRSKKVKVEATGWPDYVFAPSYELRALSEVEDHIKENGHLPEVPSAKEIEEKGLDLGVMDATLLKKVEELTLYLIDMKKEIEVLKKENRELKLEVRAKK